MKNRQNKPLPVEFRHEQQSEVDIAKNIEDWRRNRVKKLVTHSHGQTRKERYIACQAGLLASMEDAFNKIPVRARA